MSTTITYVSPANLGYFKEKLYAIFADKSLVDTLIGSDTGKSVRTIAAEELAAKLIPENADAARDTLAEIAAWIQDHPDDAAAMNSAISALQTAVSGLQTTVNGLGSLATKSTVAESDLATALKEKVNAAAEGNHSHGNKTVLDGITAAKVSAWDGKSDFSGNYNDLTNKPSIPAAYTHPSSHPASMITGLATVATSGKYSDLTGTPTIPTTVAALTDAGDYAKKSELPTFTEATNAQIDALFA